MNFLWTIVSLVITVIVVLFAVNNREVVQIELFPLPLVLFAPAYILVLGSVVLGFLVGCLAMWNAGRRYRVEARAARRRADQAERDRQQVQSVSAAYSRQGHAPNSDTVARGEIPHPAAHPLPKAMALTLKS